MVVVSCGYSWGPPGPDKIDGAGLIEERTPRRAPIRKGVALQQKLR